MRENRDSRAEATEAIREALAGLGPPGEGLGQRAPGGDPQR
jgi:hypothetical protein